jgi:hypothetical protein
MASSVSKVSAVECSVTADFWLSSLMCSEITVAGLANVYFTP